MYDYLHRIDALLMKSVERTTFGMYIRRAGFEQVRRDNKRFYAITLSTDNGQQTTVNRQQSTDNNLIKSKKLPGGKNVIA